MKQPGPAALILLSLALGALLVLPGCMATTPPAPATSYPSYVMHIPGNNHGTVLLVGRTSCPHCHDARVFLANLSIDYYWIDTDTLDQANITQVLNSLKGVCSQIESVPILVVNNQQCIIGFDETRYREALG